MELEDAVSEEEGETACKTRGDSMINHYYM